MLYGFIYFGGNGRYIGVLIVIDLLLKKDIKNITKNIKIYILVGVQDKYELELYIIWRGGNSSSIILTSRSIVISMCSIKLYPPAYKKGKQTNQFK